VENYTGYSPDEIMQYPDLPHKVYNSHKEVHHNHHNDSFFIIIMKIITPQNQPNFCVMDGNSFAMNMES